MNAMQILEIKISPADSGARLDHVVAQSAGISIQQAKSLIGAGRVRVGHHRPKKGDRACAGDLLSIELPRSQQPVPQPELPLVLVHEDASLLAVDKPAHISMHPLDPGELGTLANAVVARHPEVTDASDEERCPGLIHRLDRDTSGIVLWAKTREAFDHLRAQFGDRTVGKRYFALVENVVEGSGVFDVPLAHDPADARKMLAAPDAADADSLKARPTVTKYQAIASGANATLVDVEIPTGVRHQIRAQFAFAGHPIVGDALYGAQPVDGFERHALHAASIEFDHPGGSGRVRWSAKLPTEFVALLARHGINPPEGF